MGEDCGEDLLSIVFWCSEPAVCGAGGGEGWVCGEVEGGGACGEGGGGRRCMWGGRWREEVHVGREVEGECVER